jgi:hypothetical protein
VRQGSADWGREMLRAFFIQNLRDAICILFFCFLIFNFPLNRLQRYEKKCEHTN